MKCLQKQLRCRGLTEPTCFGLIGKTAKVILFFDNWANLSLSAIVSQPLSPCHKFVTSGRLTDIDSRNVYWCLVLWVLRWTRG